MLSWANRNCTKRNYPGAPGASQNGKLTFEFWTIFRSGVQRLPAEMCSKIKALQRSPIQLDRSLLGVRAQLDAHCTSGLFT
jgi:hypothetical protein